MREEQTPMEKMAERVRGVVDAIVGVLEDLLRPAPMPVPVRPRRPRYPVRRR